MSPVLGFPPLMETDGEDPSRYWAERLLDALSGSLLMWVYCEALFAAAGMLWKEFIGGFAAYLLLSSALVAGAPLAAYATARMLRSRRPWDCARWSLWPASLMLAAHLALSFLFKDQIAAYRDFGFAQFCSTGAWVGAFVGFFAGLAFEPQDEVSAAQTGWPLRLRNAALGIVLTGLAGFLAGSFLYFSWLRVSGDPDVHLYFAIFLLLGAPFFCSGAAQALGDARPERAAVLCVLPTFAALFIVLGGASALIDPSRADRLIGKLPWLGLAQGAACGLLCGLSFTPRA